MPLILHFGTHWKLNDDIRNFAHYPCTRMMITWQCPRRGYTTAEQVVPRFITLIL